MINELASRLLGLRKPEVSESHVRVIGILNGSSLREILVSVLLPSSGPGDDGFERAVRYDNRSPYPSMNALLYQLPHDWEPKKLTLGLHVDGGAPHLQFWAAPARELLDLMFAGHGGPLPVQNGIVAMEVTEPKSRIIYAIYWTHVDA